MNIEVRHDKQRGCGWRKPGGLYLISGGPSAPCGKLPIPLSICPCCHAGIKPTRGWTWVDGDALAAQTTCFNAPDCGGCPLARKLGMVGLLWIGGSYYPTPAHWTREAVTQGVSRRLKAIPKQFKLGETFVFVAHQQVIPAEDGKLQPGVFHIFKPTAIEYVVKGDESDEKLEALVKRGITPVRVERVEEQPELAAAPETVYVRDEYHGEYPATVVRRDGMDEEGPYVEVRDVAGRLRRVHPSSVYPVPEARS